MWRRRRRRRRRRRCCCCCCRCCCAAGRQGSHTVLLGGTLDDNLLQLASGCQCGGASAEVLVLVRHTAGQGPPLLMLPPGRRCFGAGLTAGLVRGFRPQLTSQLVADMGPALAGGLVAEMGPELTADIVLEMGQQLAGGRLACWGAAPAQQAAHWLALHACQWLAMATAAAADIAAAGRACSRPAPTIPPRRRAGVCHGRRHDLRPGGRVWPPADGAHRGRHGRARHRRPGARLWARADSEHRARAGARPGGAAGARVWAAADLGRRAGALARGAPRRSRCLWEPMAGSQCSLLPCAALAQASSPEAGSAPPRPPPPQAMQPPLTSELVGRMGPAFVAALVAALQPPATAGLVAEMGPALTAALVLRFGPPLTAGGRQASRGRCTPQSPPLASLAPLPLHLPNDTRLGALCRLARRDRAPLWAAADGRPGGGDGARADRRHRGGPGARGHCCAGAAHGRGPDLRAGAGVRPAADRAPHRCLWAAADLGAARRRPLPAQCARPARGLACCAASTRAPLAGRLAGWLACGPAAPCPPARPTAPRRRTL
jgi:hypothetical protein